MSSHAYLSYYLNENEINMLKLLEADFRLLKKIKKRKMLNDGKKKWMSCDIHLTPILKSICYVFNSYFKSNSKHFGEKLSYLYQIVMNFYICINVCMLLAVCVRERCILRQVFKKSQLTDRYTEEILVIAYINHPVGSTLLT